MDKPLGMRTKAEGAGIVAFGDAEELVHLVFTFVPAEGVGVNFRYHYGGFLDGCCSGKRQRKGDLVAKRRRGEVVMQ